LYFRYNDGSGSENSSPLKKDDSGNGVDGVKLAANSFSKELARLQFFGAGPKLAGMPTEKTAREKTRGLKANFDYDPVREESNQMYLVAWS
jgi:hypothetical protein